ncbi:MAG: SpoIIIAH-like family protein [Clostridia bacterium]|nr:SpoIIIAH-like family protein [Clostridia bacterium]
MRIIKAQNKENVKAFGEKLKDFFKKYGKRSAAIAAGVLIIGTAVTLNLVLPKTSSTAVKNNAGSTGAVKQNEDFFEASALNRTKARDEAMEVLHAVVDSGADKDASKQVLADITRISADIEKEANVETLVKAKGFEDCIAVISGDTLSIVVKIDDNLLPNEVAQIKEIAYKTASVLPENVFISLKK